MSLVGLVPAAVNAQADQTALAIRQAGAAVQAEMLKAASARKAVNEGLEGYRQQQQINDKAVDLQQTMKQPQHLCEDMGSQDALTKGGQGARGKVAAGQRKAMARVTRNTNTVATMESSYGATNQKFCSESEITQGLCRAPADAKYANLAGADQDAMFLFQSRGGNATYEGERDGAQVDAVDAYIARVVAGGTPPEQLRSQGVSAYGTNAQARLHVEMQRRYNAFLSMATYSLNRIKESRNPLKGS